MPDPTLMFCIGATKAGTSWLHRYISDHPQCYMRGVKELHYFDALDFNDFDPWIKDLRGRRDDNLGALDNVSVAMRPLKERVARDADDWLRILQGRRADDAAYLAYLVDGLTDQRLVGDFTPAYGLLSAERLTKMAALLPDVRIVYLLRDPVARMWSNIRMLAKRRSATPYEIGYRSVHIVRRMLIGKEPEVIRRSDYITPVRNLRAAVAPDKLRFMFYEDMFSQPAMDGLCGFLGLDPAPADFTKRVLAGPEAEMDDGQYDAMRALLAPQYDFIEETFDRVPAQWRVKGEGVA